MFHARHITIQDSLECEKKTKETTLKARPRLAGGSSSGIVASVRMVTVCITRTAFSGYLLTPKFVRYL